ncbi:MAG: endonuclease/exonuclease/phosphatase family protein [Ginsengibacter sp.]
MKRKPGLVRKFLIVTNIVVIISYIITCFIPFINTDKYWFLALPGLVFPVIIFALICFIILWAILKSKWWLISTVVLLLGFQQITAVIAFNFANNKIYYGNPGSLRVMQWNTSDWDQQNLSAPDGTGYRDDMFELIKDLNPDILCVEEYFDYTSKKHDQPNRKALSALGYSYNYVVPTVRYTNLFISGIAIFSKHPIVDSGNFAYNESRKSEHLVFADIKVKEKTYRFFATHLQSVKFEGEDYQNIYQMKRGSKPNISGSRTIVSKLRRGYKLRYDQANLASSIIQQSPHPVILCGDFNDVPNSYTYFKMKGDLQDAFLKKGWGIGRSFIYISPTLRIDYILPDKSFKVKRFEIIHVPYSVHYPLITDLEF